MVFVLFDDLANSHLYFVHAWFFIPLATLSFIWIAISILFREKFLSRVHVCWSYMENTT